MNDLPQPPGSHRRTAGRATSESRTGDFLADGGDPARGESENETKTWRFETSGRVRGSPAVDEHTVYFGSTDGALYAIDRTTGIERWRVETHSVRMHAPSVVEDTVFAASGEAVYAVDAASGQPRWRYPDQRIMREPVVYADYVYVYATDRDGWRVHAIDRVTGEERWRVSENVEVGDQLHTNITRTADGISMGTWNAIHAFNGDDGQSSWTVERGQSVESLDGMDEVIYTGGRTTDESPNVHAYDSASGTQLWESTTRPGEWITAVTVQDDSVFAAGIEDHGDGTKTRHLTALDIEDGSTRWTTVTAEETTASVPPRPVAVDRDRIVAGGTRYLSVIDPSDGALIDRLDVGEEVHTRPALDGNEVYVGADEGNVYAYELSS